jgi:Fe-S cluster biogenesis protein NfuA/glutaredoxin
LRKRQVAQGLIPEDVSAPPPEQGAEDEGEPVVEIYFKRGCPYTRAAIQLLLEREIPVREFDVTEDEVLYGWMKRETGRTSSPQLFIHGRPIGGFDDLRELDERGQLRALVDGVTDDEPATQVAAAKRRLPVIGQAQYPENSPFERDVLDVVKAPAEDRLEGEALTARVREVLDECRPMIQADGGDVELLDIQGDVVAVALTGNCIGCPSAQATLHQGIERRLRQRIPQIKGIRSPQFAQ